jgi:hypothetical protein
LASPEISGLPDISLSPLPPGEHNDAQSFAQTRTLRIKQMNGLELSTDKLDLAASDRGDLTTA